MTKQVYLFALDGLHKIGCSGNPEKRLNTVAKGGQIVHLIDSANPYQIETALLKRFTASHVDGEWFGLAEEDVSLICSVKQADTVSDLPAHLQPPVDVRGAPGRIRPVQPKATIFVQVPPELKARLQAIAHRNWRTLAAEVVRALESHLDIEEATPCDLPSRP